MTLPFIFYDFGGNTEERELTASKRLGPAGVDATQEKGRTGFGGGGHDMPSDAEGSAGLKACFVSLEEGKEAWIESTCLTTFHSNVLWRGGLEVTGSLFDRCIR